MADMSGADAYNIARSAKDLDIKGDTKDATKASLKGDVNSLAENETVGKGVEIAANKTNNPYVHAADAAIKMKKNLKKQGVDVNLNKPVKSAATLANPKNRKAIANAAADTAKQKAASFTGKKLAGADGIRKAKLTPIRRIRKKTESLTLIRLMARRRIKIKKKKKRVKTIIRTKTRTSLLRK